MASVALTLTPDEVKDLTGRTRRPAQVKVLRHMGIEHRVRPDGSVAVLRAHVETLLGSQHGATVRREVEPDWSAL